MEALNKQEVWEKYLPEAKYLNLYYVNYDDSLRGHKDLLQQCIDKNSLQPLSEKVYDFWDYPEQYELEQIEQKMAKDGLEVEFEKSRDEIRGWLFDHDQSDPETDLLDNTGELDCFYSTGIDLDHGYHEAAFCTPWQNNSCKQSAARIRKLLGIKKDAEDAQKILDMCYESSYGGELRFYFRADVRNLISENKWGDAESKKDFQTITFKGEVVVAVYNAGQGAGDYVELDIESCTLPFIRENLVLSETEKYSIESCFGMCGDWLYKIDKPEFSMNKPKTVKRSIKASAAMQQEKEFDKVFQSGGCSFNDCNMDRHRDTYYTDTLPFGFKCPHCGRMWYD